MTTQHSRAPLRLIQIGMNTADLPATLECFSEAFGLRNAGGQVILGHLIQIQGLDPTSHALMWWLVGAEPRFQFEFFHHTRPAQRPLRPDWSPADHGWTRLGIAVEAFDLAIDELAKRGIALIAPPRAVGGLRRAAFRDPHIGVIVEVMEDGEVLRAHSERSAGPALVYAACSVSDLESARGFYRDVVGLPLRDEVLHSDADETLWGLDGVKASRAVVDAGSVLLELVQYDTPRGRPRRADYRASDQGIVNVAFGSTTKDVMVDTFARLAAAGYRPPHIVETDLMLAGYITAPEREIELAVIPPELEAALGFTPASPFLGGRE